MSGKINQLERRAERGINIDHQAIYSLRPHTAEREGFVAEVSI